MRAVCLYCVLFFAGLSPAPTTEQERLYAGAVQMIGDEPIEHVLFIALTGTTGLYHHSTGTPSRAPVYPQRLCRHARAHGGTVIALVHNHPNGVLRPSPADLATTAYLRHECALIGVFLVDHLIVGRGRYYSLALDREFP